MGMPHTRPFHSHRRAMATVIALLLTVPLIRPGAVSGQSPTALDGILSQVSGQRAYRHIVEIAQRIGPHVAGTPEDRMAGEYIARQLSGDGYVVEWQPFPFSYFVVRAVALTVPSSPALVLHPHAMLYAPSTPDGGLTAELVDVGLGRPDDIRGKSLAGKIALIQRGGMTFRDKASNVAAAGAAGAVIYNFSPQDFQGIVGRDATIPVVSLSGTEGQSLLGLLRSGPVTAHVNVQAANEQRTSWNIIGTKVGFRDPHRVLVVGAHRDTVEDAPGANDNTSGVATALEVAEVLRRVPLALTVRFVFFGAEEYGLFGSEYYVQHMGSDPVVGMVNLDMEGVGGRLQLARYRGRDDLVNAAAQTAGRLGIKVTVQSSDGSDHVSFERVGVPVVFLFRPDDPYYDTPKDTVDRVDPKLVEVSARLATAIVIDLAGPSQ